MIALLSLLLVLLPSRADAKVRTPETPVRATLGDGQILMGEVETRTLQLVSGSGMLEIPLADVGEVVPAGGELGMAEGRVDVWLRNGSQLRGTWADPKLAMTIAVGGDDVAIDLPMNDLSRFQLQGGTRWPAGPVYRLRTAFGDDFLVDPSRTHLIVENEFGTFEPLLSECRSVAPVGDPLGLWRVELQTGTVLLGHLQDHKVTVALPMGPEEISVPLDQFVSLHIERWAPVGMQPPVRDDRRVDTGGAVEDAAEVDAEPVYETAMAAPSQGARDGGGRSAKATTGAPEAQKTAGETAGVAQEEWFDSSGMAASKGE